MSKDVVRKEVVIDTSSATKPMNELDNAISKTGESSKKTSKDLKNLDKSIDKTAAGAKKSNKAFSSLKSVFKPLTGAVNGFGAALKANPIIAVAALITGLIKIMAKALEPFQPLLDWISDKIAYVDGLITGFMSSLSKMGDIMKSVFEGNFAEAAKQAEELGANISAVADATEKLNRVMREQDRQQKENDLTTAESMQQQKELEIVLKDTTASYKDRAEALKVLSKIQKGQAQDDINEKKARLTAVNDEINAKLRAKGIDIDIAKVESGLLVDRFKELMLTDAIYDDLIDARTALAAVDAASADVDLKLIKYKLQVQRAAEADAKENAESKAERDEAERIINENEIKHLETKGALIVDLDAKMQASFNKRMKNEANVKNKASDNDIKNLQRRALIEKQIAEQQKQINKDVAMQGLDAIGIIATANDEDSEAAKGVAVAQSVINTAQGVTQALAQGGLLGIATGVVVGIAGAITIDKIINTKIPKRSVGGGSSRGIQRPSPVSLPTADISDFNNLNSEGVELDSSKQLLNDQSREPLRAFVVLSDLEDANNTNQNITENASI